MFFYIYSFIVGLFLGSFLLVVIERFARGESFVKGRSKCEYCDHDLSWYDLLPILSFVFLRGRCRYCNKKLSLTYPLFELGTGIFMLFSVSQLIDPALFIFSFEQIFLYAFLLYLLCACILIFFIDLKMGIIPFFIVIPLIAILLIKNIVFPMTSAPYFLLSGLGGFLFLFSIFLVTKGRGMGFGDCVLALLMGLLLGFPYIVTAFYTAFLTGAFVSLILIIWKKKKLRNSTIPFGPFLIFGTYLTLLYGPVITSYFLHLVLH